MSNHLKASSETSMRESLLALTCDLKERICEFQVEKAASAKWNRAVRQPKRAKDELRQVTSTNLQSQRRQTPLKYAVITREYRHST
jgi:hypothetical protein